MLGTMGRGRIHRHAIGTEYDYSRCYGALASPLAINDRVEPGDIVYSHDTLRSGVESYRCQECPGFEHVVAFRLPFLFRSSSSCCRRVARVWRS